MFFEIRVLRCAFCTHIYCLPSEQLEDSSAGFTGRENPFGAEQARKNHSSNEWVIKESYREEKEEPLWARGYYVDTVGKYEGTITKYICTQ